MKTKSFLANLWSFVDAVVAGVVLFVSLGVLLIIEFIRFTIFSPIAFFIKLPFRRFLQDKEETRRKVEVARLLKERKDQEETYQLKYAELQERGKSLVEEIKQKWSIPADAEIKVMPRSLREPWETIVVIKIASWASFAHMVHQLNPRKVTVSWYNWYGEAQTMDFCTGNGVSVLLETAGCSIDETSREFKRLGLPITKVEELTKGWRSIGPSWQLVLEWVAS